MLQLLQPVEAGETHPVTHATHSFVGCVVCWHVWSATVRRADTIVHEPCINCQLCFVLQAQCEQPDHTCECSLSHSLTLPSSSSSSRSHSHSRSRSRARSSPTIRISITRQLAYRPNAHTQCNARQCYTALSDITITTTHTDISCLLGREKASNVVDTATAVRVHVCVRQQHDREQ